MSHQFSIDSTDVVEAGTRDGQGAGDHDQPFEFHRPRAHAPFPFRLREYAHLLILRSRVEDGSFAADDVGRARLTLRWPPHVTSGWSPWFRCVDCGDQAPLAKQLGDPTRCGACEQARVHREVVHAILFTAGV
jgi:hypothetical protein